ncbi:iron-siderophore ABC transporter substrate-binding protein [Amycolatopsis minnesotensis]|uniref:Iron-siderophore ABC transporter substrate-binding protein n=1 Tax=Amycolatopsis minnesotensis TaxID=337894 RepID=A0ABP5BAY6_9PSEU
MFLGAAGLALGGCGVPGPTRTTVPQRIVALGYGKDADAAAALGVPPVAVPRPSELSELEPWTSQALAGARPEFLDVGTGLPFEKIAALRPDLITATGLYSLEAGYAQLSRIAPVLAYTAGPNLDRWQDTTMRTGTALNRVDAAKRAVGRVEGLVRTAKDRFPRLTGKTFTFTSYGDGTRLWTKNAREDVIATTLAGFGLALSPAVTALPSSATKGLSAISLERLDVLAADVTMMLFTSPQRRAAFEQNPAFARFASAGSYLPITVTEGHAMAFPSALSVEWLATGFVGRIAELLG